MIESNIYFTSSRLLYRPYKYDEIKDLVKLHNEKTFLSWFYFLPKMNEAIAVEEIKQMIDTWSRPVNILKDCCTLAIIRKDTEELIGSIGLSRFHGAEELENVEIGYDIGEAHQGNGYATEAVKAVVDWGMARLYEAGAVQRIVGKVEHENWASRKVLEKAGFSFTHAERYCSVYQYV